MKTKPKMMYTVFGIYVPNRIKLATDIQEVLTEYGCNIRTRIGLHNVDKDPSNGLLLLEMYGVENIFKEIITKLKAIDNKIDIQQMVFPFNPSNFMSSN